MHASFWRRGGRLWLQGGALLLLRLWQNRTGFDPVTGLAVPSMAGTLLLAGIVLCLAAEAVLVFRLPRGGAPWGETFRAPDQKLLPAAVAGCLLLVMGGGLLAVRGAAQGLVFAAAGVLAVAAGAGLLALLRTARAGKTPPVWTAVPAMLFGALWLLAIYIPAEGDPVLARTGLPILAGALSAWAFSLLGGLLRGETGVRGFTFVADLAVLACLAAAPDGGAEQTLLRLGCGLTLTVFLLLWQGGEAAR